MILKETLANYAVQNGYVNGAKKTDLYIQMGTDLFAPGGTSKTFPVAFSETPVVIVAVNDPSPFTCAITGTTTTYFTARHGYAGGNIYLNWIAIGVRVNL